MYQVCGVWEIGYWKDTSLKNLLPALTGTVVWTTAVCLSACPKDAHSPNGGDGTDNAWFPGPDHTGNKDTHGNTDGLMLVVNAALEQGMFYKREINGLCYGARFESSAWYANILEPNACVGGGSRAINIRYEIWNQAPGNDESAANVIVGGSACTGATLLALTNTGNVAHLPTLTWNQTSLNFFALLIKITYILSLEIMPPGGCGNTSLIMIYL